MNHRIAVPRNVSICNGILASTFLLLLLSCVHGPQPITPPGTHPPALVAPPEAATGPENSSNALITVDLLVRDKRHQPVLNLDPSQLTVTDTGVPVHLASLRPMVPASESQNLVAFLFDRPNRGAAVSTRRAAERILGVIPDEGYSLAVLQMNGRLRLLQGYTSDFRLADSAVSAATDSSLLTLSTDPGSEEKALLDSVHDGAVSLNAANRARARTLLAAIEETQRTLEERRMHPSLAALQALVQSHRLLPGRKFIFYFSNSAGMDAHASQTLHSIVAAANRASVIICVVDTGTELASMSSNLQASLASSVLGSGETSGAISSFGASKSIQSSAPAAMQSSLVHNVAGFEFGSIDAEQSLLTALASGTGGLSFNVHSFSKTQLDQLHQDLTHWYQASWVPQVTQFDGQFRPIEVRSPRKDVLVRARSGYFALPPTGGSEVLPFEMPLLKTLADTTLPTDVLYRAKILHLGASPEGNSADLVVQVPVTQLEMYEDNNIHISSVHASIMAVIKDSKGAVLQRFAQDFPLRQAPGVFRVHPGQTITLQRPFSAEPGVYTLETVVMDRVSNKSGAQRLTFTIEPPKAGPALSDLTLVQSIEPVETENQGLEPMRYLDGRVIPNLASELPSDTSSFGFFLLLHPVASSSTQPAVRMQIIHHGRSLTDMPMDLHAVSGTGAGIPYLITISGKVFPPGEYQIKASLTQDGKTASSSATFRIAEPLAASDTAVKASTGVTRTDRDAQDSASPGEQPIAGVSIVLMHATNSVPQPGKAEMEAMLEEARRRALAWSDSLRNFLCIETTDHFVNDTASQSWKHRGTLVETLRYVDHEQTRTPVLFNGEPSTAQPDRLDFAHSNGEFGAMFHIVFDPSAKAAFAWKGYASLDGEPVQVFTFQVARANSSFNLSDRDNHTATIGFHGLLYLDPATDSVRRLSIVADDIPPTLLIRASSISVDYSWISMQNHEFLLPVRGTVSLQETKRPSVLNEFEFRDYHRFGSQVRIRAAQ